MANHIPAGGAYNEYLSGLDLQEIYGGEQGTMNWQETVIQASEVVAAIASKKGLLSQANAVLDYLSPKLDAMADEAYNRGYEARKSEMCNHCDTPLLREVELYEKLDEAEQRGIRQVVEWIYKNGFELAGDLAVDFIKWQAFLKEITKPVKGVEK